LAVEILLELETKIDTVLSSVKTLKEENAKVSQDLAETRQKIQELEAIYTTLARDLESSKNEVNDKQAKLDNAIEKIQGMLSKLESAA
jgi:predicted  nucleic acid-binding Zn-ribbon protein